MAKEIMKTHDLKFCSRRTLCGQQKLSYNGLDLTFSLYDSYWREIRKICVVHLFNPNRVLLQRPTREDEVARMIEKISTSSAGSKPINLSKTLMCLTSTIICRVGFDKGYDEERIERSRFHALLNETQAMPKPEHKDILDVLLQIWKDRVFQVDLTLEHIKVVLMNVFIGGSDTSAATVIWAMTVLMKNPKCTNKVQEEFDWKESFCR
ncbi:hypothetical protein PTKIN_Ptkin16aG0036300 [Pterospermum kingtungense]